MFGYLIVLFFVNCFVRTYQGNLLTVCPRQNSTKCNYTNMIEINDRCLCSNGFELSEYFGCCVDKRFFNCTENNPNSPDTNELYYHDKCSDYDPNRKCLEPITGVKTNKLEKIESVCACKNGYEVDLKTNMCVFSVNATTINQHCYNNTYCNSDKNQFCVLIGSSYVCRCLPNFAVDDNECTRLRCSSHSDCLTDYDQNKYCVDDYCECQDGFTTYKGPICQPEVNVIFKLLYYFIILMLIILILFITILIIKKYLLRIIPRLRSTSEIFFQNCSIGRSNVRNVYERLHSSDQDTVTEEFLSNHGYNKNFVVLSRGNNKVFKVQLEGQQKFHVIKTLKFNFNNHSSDSNDPRIKRESNFTQFFEKLRNLEGNDFVVKFHDNKRIGNFSFIIMEYCPFTLENLIAAKRKFLKLFMFKGFSFRKNKYKSLILLEYQLAFGILYNLAECILYLHSLKIYHRDLKPGNILVNFSAKRRRCLKLCDFGLSKFENENTRHDDVGTSIYKAPEIKITNGKYTFKSDIYSFGVIISKDLFSFNNFK